MLSFVRIWGCDVYVRKLFSDKLEPKSEKCLFVGYPKETKGYYFYNPEENKVFIARRGTFLEEDFISQRASGSRIDLEEVRDPEINVEPMEIHPNPSIVEDVEPSAQG
ncbi:MAG TPA: hypothetical protein VIH90_06815, partial [Candidatus Saccharimonadales bacterium]